MTKLSIVQLLGTHTHTWKEAPPNAHTDSSHRPPIRGIVKSHTHKLRAHYQYKPTYCHITQASTHLAEPHTDTSKDATIINP